MIVSRRGAMAGIATAAGAGSAATRMTGTAASPALPSANGERLSASVLGIRGDNTTADTDHAQRMIEEAAREFRTIHFEGRHEWVFRTSLTLFGSEDRGSTMLRGEGAYATVLRSSDETKPVFINDTSENDFRRLSIRGLTIRGGSRGLSIQRKADQVASLLDLQDVRFELQKEVGLHCDQYLISSSLSDVVFYYCNRGIYCGRNANNILLLKPRFEGLNDRSVELASPGQGVNGCEDVRFVSPRFEGRNNEPQPGAFVIGGYRLSTLTIEGGYFEDSHALVLHERGGLGQVAFRNCHFSGQASVAGKLQKEIFDSDSIVTLDGNRFVTGTDGAQHMLVSGVNRGLARSKFGCFTSFGADLRFIGAVVPLRDRSTRVLTLSWAKWASPEDRRSAALTGQMRVSILTASAAQSGALRYDLVVMSDPEGMLRIKIIPLQSTSGYNITTLKMSDDAVGVMLITDSIIANAVAIAEIQAVIAVPLEPPFLFE